MSTQLKLPAKLQLQLHHEITKDQIFNAMTEIFKLSGCLSCGIRGIDLRLIGSGDPGPEVAAVRNLPGVAGMVSG